MWFHTDLENYKPTVQVVTDVIPVSNIKFYERFDRAEERLLDIDSTDRPIRVLVAEDNQLNQKVIEAMLTRSNYIVPFGLQYPSPPSPGITMFSLG